MCTQCMLHRLFTSYSGLGSGACSHSQSAFPFLFSFPCRCENGEIHVVDDLELTDFAKAKIQENVEALLAERSAVADLL